MPCLSKVVYLKKSALDFVLTYCALQRLSLSGKERLREQWKTFPLKKEIPIIILAAIVCKENFLFQITIFFHAQKFTQAWKAYNQPTNAKAWNWANHIPKTNTSRANWCQLNTGHALVAFLFKSSMWQFFYLSYELFCKGVL